MIRKIKEAYINIDNKLFAIQERIESSINPTLEYATAGCFGLIIIALSAVVFWAVQAWLETVDWSAVVDIIAYRVETFGAVK